MSSRLSATLVTSLQQVVGTQHVLTDPARTEPFRTGYRFGSGKALAVVQPGTLLEYWRVLQVCVAGDAIIISQAANTGLTGGSTPSGDDYERDIVIINTLRMDGIQLLNRAEQVVCLPGSTLNALEVLLKKHGREPAHWCSGARPTRRWRCTHSSMPAASCSWSITWALRWATRRKKS